MNIFARWVIEGGSTLLTPYQRSTHTYVIGQPGTGKSRALESWIMRDIDAGRGVGVVDPHGDLFNNLLVRLSSKPEVWKRLIIIDPTNPKWTVSFNPLKPMRDYPYERLATALTDVIIRMWNVNPGSAPRMIWLLTNSFVALSSLGLTLLDLPRFLGDRKFREGFLPQVENYEARMYFEHQFPKTEGAVHQWITPVLNKVGRLIFDPDMRLMMGGGTPLDFRQIIDDDRIVLVNIPKGILGESTSALLGAFIVSHLQKAALSRADSEGRAPFYLYLDEFQNYSAEIVQSILTETRKYRLSLTIAHQYLDQLSPDTRSAVLNSSGSIISFRVGYHDATQLVKEIFPAPDFISNYEFRPRVQSIGHWPMLTVEENKVPIGWDGLTQQMANMRERIFWVRRKGPHRPVKHRTYSMELPIIDNRTKTNILDMLSTSGALYGRSKVDAQHEFDERYRLSFANSEGNSFVDLDSLLNSELPPFWSER